MTECKRDMDSEAALVGRLQRGDERALAELYDRLGTHVYALALKLLRSPEEAEEVVQDTFLKLYEADSYKTLERSPRAYIYTIARNLALSRLRKRQVRPTKAEEWDVYDPRSDLAEPQSADHESKLLAERLLAYLSDDERALVEDSFYEGYTHSQLAKRTGLPLGTVKSKLRRALLKLRDYWETL